MLTAFIAFTVLALASAIALQMRADSARTRTYQPREQELPDRLFEYQRSFPYQEYNLPVLAQIRQFLKAFVLAIHKLFSRAAAAIDDRAQIALMQIRFIINTVLFGRGLLHS